MKNLGKAKTLAELVAILTPLAISNPGLTWYGWDDGSLIVTDTDKDVGYIDSDVYEKP